MTEFERAHYAEADYLATVEWDQPTIFTEATSEGLDVLFDKLTAALSIVHSMSDIDIGIQSELTILMWDIATEVDRRDPDDVQHHLAGGKK